MKILSPSSIDLLKLSLSLRMYSPTVQSFQQIGSEHALPCAAFFDVHGVKGCNTDELENALKSAHERDAPELLSIDHVFNLGREAETVAIIYGEIGTQEWLQLHNKAVELASAGKMRYVLRHYKAVGTHMSQVSLSGYGVELAIKSTEYKAVDTSEQKNEEEPDEENFYGFNFKQLKKIHSDSSDHLESFKMHLKEMQDLGPLKQWQLQDLSFQAAQRIISEEGENALQTLTQLSQDFPRYARSLTREIVLKDVRREIELNQKDHLSDAGTDVKLILFELHCVLQLIMPRSKLINCIVIGLQPGESALFLNGMNLDMESLDLFQLFDIIRQEQRVSAGFFNMGFRQGHLPILTNIDLSEDKSKYAVDYRNANPIYLNNLDTDMRYKHWRNSVKLLLEPYYPGMIRPIARNLFNLVSSFYFLEYIFVVDPAGKESRKLMKMALSLFQHDVPLRIGFLFAVEDNGTVSGMDDSGIGILNLLNFLAADHTYHDALRTVVDMLEPYSTQESVDLEYMKAWFEKNHESDDYEEVFGPNSPYDKGRTSGKMFLEQTGIGSAPKVLLNGFVLDDAGVTGDKFEETLMLEVMRITQELQKAVIRGELHDQLNVGNWIMEQKDVVPRYNKHIIDATAQKNILDFTDVSDCNVNSVSDFVKLKDSEKIQCIATKMRYVKKSDEDSTMPLTLWIVADLESEHGRQMVYNAIKFLKHNRKTRMGLIMNPSDTAASCTKNSISMLVQAAIKFLPHVQAKQFITKLVKEEYANSIRSGATKWEDLAVGGMDVDKFRKQMENLPCEQLEIDSVFVRDVLKLAPGKRAFIANGIIVGPFEEEEIIIESDVELIARIVESRGANVIASQIDEWKAGGDHGSPSDLVMRSFALISKYAIRRERTWITLGQEKHSVVKLVADDHDRAAVNIVAVVDPLSRSTQKLSAILQLLRKSINCDMKIVMNPKAKLSELPLKRFYRFVASPELQFDKNGRIIENQARFNDLPPKQLLTLSVYSPDAWMVENVFAEYDLDNIKMEQASSHIIARFSLEYILLEGHCFDEVSGSPPRGLQFVLGTSREPTQFDTIVMANLGYFQLKANPGAWLLQIREGKSSEFYNISAHSNTEGNEGNGVRVVIDSFSGRTVRIYVTKKKGMEQRSFLSDENENGGGIWDSISKSFTKEKYDVINVFSLASGQLYERFLNIMMVSVVKKTEKPVKFWLLKNYLSPQFKESLPLLSREYGFDYALVEYKWPRWLHQQKEKHRVMWGYKILFLDVLFPLDVQKIIFVDADQVVRADLMELMEFDLGGAPYGYVPFCDSRKEMDGFRFWKQGYWSNHLAGRRYHISALYVVDLQKFRQVAAGDRLRGQYQGLSNDPNSLSNLDQDLPNNMIHQVKIKSLPQEWLWCETWCDDASKQNAKTIDLCNNPLTKEPKLDSAIRIIPEWRDYDAEIRGVLKNDRKHQKEASEGHEHSEL
ncbi:UDP-glucose:Glycoprotein Glucosyltransferase [Ostertagia ostertagi]